MSTKQRLSNTKPHRLDIVGIRTVVQQSTFVACLYNRGIIRFCLIAFLSFPCHSSSAQYVVETIPNQKILNGSYVSNPDKVLTDDAVTMIDAVLTNIENDLTVQVAVVAVNSIGDADIFDFAQQLFDNWGIGNMENDNGLLILLVKESHTIRFHTGGGIQGVLPDATCKRIQREFMILHFKEEDYDAGMLAGLSHVEKILRNPSSAEDLIALEDNDYSISNYAAPAILMIIFFGPLVAWGYVVIKTRFSNTSETSYIEMILSRKQKRIIFPGIPLLIICLYAIIDTNDPITYCIVTLYVFFGLTLFYRQLRMKKVIARLAKNGQYYEITEFLRKETPHWFFMALLYPLPFLFYFPYHLARRRIFRNHARQCACCHADMQKLDEKDDDAFLSQAQQLEEAIRSIDYDVWQCRNCRATQEWNYPKRRSKYSVCPHCQATTYYRVSKKTITSATYSSEGCGQIIHQCKFCKRSNTETYTIAMLTESSSIDRSSSDSSSSSNSGSWGGGSSDGGGASSSW